MGKIRVHELAKEINAESKKIIEVLNKKGYQVKNHMSVLNDEQVEVAKTELGVIKKSDGFKPKIKRIPRAQVEAEAAQKAAEEAKAAAAKETDAAVPAQPKEIQAPAAAVQSASAQQTRQETPPETSQPAAARTEASPQEMPKEKTTSVQPKADKSDGFVVDEKDHLITDEKSQPQAAKPEPAVVKPEPAARVKETKETVSPQPEAPARATSPRAAESRPEKRTPRPPKGAGERSARNEQRPPYNRDNRGNRDNRDNRNTRGNYSGGRDNRGGFHNDARGGFKKDNRGGMSNRGTRPAPKRDRFEQPVGEMRYATASTYKPNNKKQDAKKRENREQTFYNDRYKDHEFQKKNKNRPKNKYKEQKKQKKVMPPVTPKKIIINETVSVQELAKNMSKTASEVIKKLFEMGIMATINQELDADTAILLADEFGITVEVKQEKIDEILFDDDDNPRDLKSRPPVVTVMGHVDHGKTSLLDVIRKTSVTATEAGGITQHIGAYQVEIDGKKITFLDTPGHEAFTSMRARGAQVTDISILVVAADDGVMPQTIEAINHSKAAGVPIIVAINKIDKPGANPDRVRQELMEHGLVCEEWGGDVIMVPVSAKKGEGIDTLLEMILLVAEMGELKANPRRQARGTVIEAKLDKSRGPVATLLVQKGTLKIGETVVAGSVFGKIRAMVDDKHRTVKSAGPSMPVEVLGFSEVPEAGEIFMAIKDEKDARYAAQIQAIKKREEEMRKNSKVSLDDLFKKIAEGDMKDLNIVIKADVQGSAEAVKQSLEKLSTSEVKVNVIHVGVGGISESDVMLADASNAIIIGFNVRPVAQASKTVEATGVDMRLYRVIYDAIEDVKKAMAGLLEPEYKEKVLGQAEVRDTFKVPKVGVIAGAYVTEGKVTRQAQVRIVRDGIVVWEGQIASLRRFKDDVKEVVQGYECGIGIENYNDIKVGDILEAFIMEETERDISDL